MSKEITTQNIKEKFLEFFQKKNHKIISQVSLIPENDPTVLFTTAGMHPLVPFLLGEEHPFGKRLANSQNCIRTTDIDEVGDDVHFTFFEMLGSWSIGDYFKEEAIDLAYEFLTSKDYLNLNKEKLAVSCFSGNKDIPRDIEAYDLWRKKGISEKKITFLKDNWWGPAGTIGPCGPDTEIFYWKSKEPVPETFDSSNDNWVEIWNLVLMGYNKNKDETFSILKQKNIDTGMGLERITMVLNNFENVYEVKPINEILKFLETLTNQKINEENIKSYRIIFDHLRASTFILGDNRAIPPSNVDQGYVIRKLIRRAIRHGKNIGLTNNFCSSVCEFIIQKYKEQFPNILENKTFILQETEKEETKFRKTLEKGLREIHKMLEKNESLSDKQSFLLYQSFGFPIELIEEICKEQNKSVDIKGFYNLFKEHQKLSKQQSEQKFKGGLAEENDINKRYHTITHILNEALRKVISKDIKQKGSNINSQRLRFDFNFDRKLTNEEIKKVEVEVNKVISQNLPITKVLMDKDDALKNETIQHEFGNKYPDKVWVYSVGNYTKEICMGPHVENTKEIGIFKIIKEESVAAGIRRIKGVIV